MKYHLHYQTRVVDYKHPTRLMSYPVQPPKPRHRHRHGHSHPMMIWEWEWEWEWVANLHNLIYLSGFNHTIVHYFCLMHAIRIIYNNYNISKS
jgi:hypothetical protein